MNFLKNIFGKQEQKQESRDSIKVYLNEELKAPKILTIHNDTTAETIVQTLLPDGEVKKNYFSPSHENLYLLLIIRNSKSNLLVLKRRINPFEYIREIENTKTEDQDFIWMLQMHIEQSKINSFRESIANDPLNEQNIFVERYKPIEQEVFERRGRLQKKSKKGELKEKEFVLYKDKLKYFKPEDKNRKYSAIPLVNARAEKNTLNPKEKHMFDIKTPDQTFTLKAVSDVDMKNWIFAFNSLADIETENTIMSNRDKDIRNLEYKFEKNSNEELKKKLEDFEKLMSKKDYRRLLFTFFASDDDCYRKAEQLASGIYNLKKNSDQAKWLETLDGFWEDLESFYNEYRKKLEEVNESSSGDQINLIKTFYERIVDEKVIESIRNDYERVKVDCKDENKLKIMASLDDILKSILGIFRKEYNELMRSSEEFQEKLTDMMKSPFFKVHSFQKCSIFEKSKREQHSSTINTKSAVVKDSPLMQSVIQK